MVGTSVGESGGNNWAAGCYKEARVPLRKMAPAASSSNDWYCVLLVPCTRTVHRSQVTWGQGQIPSNLY